MFDEVLLSWRWLNVCLLMGSSELILYFNFALPIKLSLSQHMSFLTFTLHILFSILPGGSE